MFVYVLAVQHYRVGFDVSQVLLVLEEDHLPQLLDLFVLEQAL